MTQPASEKSTVQLGLAMTCVGVVVGAIWWAATISANVSAISGTLTEVVLSINEIRSEMPSVRINHDKILELKDHIDALDETVLGHELRIIAIENRQKE